MSNMGLCAYGNLRAQAKQFRVSTLRLGRAQEGKVLATDFGFPVDADLQSRNRVLRSEFQRPRFYVKWNKIADCGEHFRDLRLY